MKNYMGHFGELSQADSLLSKISDLEVMIADNELLIKALNDDKKQVEAAFSVISNNLSNIDARLAALEKKANDSYNSFIKNMSNAAIKIW